MKRSEMLDIIMAELANLFPFQKDDPDGEKTYSLLQNKADNILYAVEKNGMVSSMLGYEDGFENRWEEE